ncbi:MAG: signal recognition particle protein [Fidelibacterota bacterium]
MLEQLTDRFDTIFRNVRGLGKITDANIHQTSREIRRVLLEADVNFAVAKSFVQRIADRAQGTKVIKSIKPGEQFVKIVHGELVALLGNDPTPVTLQKNDLTVILMAGLQGSGKTTTSAKLANWFQQKGHTVLLVAADVYRPAAIDQLKTLGEGIGCPVFDRGQTNPVHVCREAKREAENDSYDIMIIDSAGRLHVDDDMMKELVSLQAVLQPQEILFVVDGMTGQDAVNSAGAFHEQLPLTGTVLTKLDGDARGGAALSIVDVTGLPIKFIGTSEKIDGIEYFDPVRMANRILGYGDVLSLVEKAQRVVDEKEASRIEKKIRQQSFDLNDFLSQIHQLKKMGPLEDLIGMMPGMNKKMLRGAVLDDRAVVWMEAIIQSMTPQERANPAILNGSRRKRIAMGSGRSLYEINQLLKQYHHLQKMMKKFGRMRQPLLGKMQGAFKQFS